MILVSDKCCNMFKYGGRKIKLCIKIGKKMSRVMEEFAKHIGVDVNNLQFHLKDTGEKVEREHRAGQYGVKVVLVRRKSSMFAEASQCRIMFKYGCKRLMVHTLVGKKMSRAMAVFVKNRGVDVNYLQFHLKDTGEKVERENKAGQCRGKVVLVRTIQKKGDASEEEEPMVQVRG